MKIPPRFVLFALAGSLFSLTGCLFKPDAPVVRFFTLSASPTVASAAAPPTGAPAIGLAQVRLPPYLFSSSMAFRRGTNEIAYDVNSQWAERLDLGLQRVLAADLALLLGTPQVRLTAWSPRDVAVELYVSVEQFEVDTAGQGILAARWRLLSPGSGETLQAGQFQTARPGEPGPQNAAATLSELAGEFTRQLAPAIQSAASRGRAP